MIKKFEIPNPNNVLPTDYNTICFIKNVIKSPNIVVGDYTYYDDELSPTEFEKNNVLFNHQQFGDKLVIGKFCAIACGTQFIMGAANHRTNSVSTYPFNVFGGVWAEKTDLHIDSFPHKGDIVVGNDVWFGRECVIMPGVKIGDGAIIGARSVVAKDVPSYAIACGNPAKVVKMRFDDEFIELLQELKWWDFGTNELAKFLPILCSNDIDSVKIAVLNVLKKRKSSVQCF